MAFLCYYYIVPEEIESQGEQAKSAYLQALRDGSVNVYRGRILLIGQDRAGKTSLKKSLTGRPFNSKEQSTEGIQVDPSMFEIDVDQVKNWQSVCENEQGLLGCAKDIAKIVTSKLPSINFYKDSAYWGFSEFSRDVTEMMSARLPVFDPSIYSLEDILDEMDESQEDRENEWDFMNFSEEGTDSWDVNWDEDESEEDQEIDIEDVDDNDTYSEEEEEEEKAEDSLVNQVCQFRMSG